MARRQRTEVAPPAPQRPWLLSGVLVLVAIVLPVVVALLLPWVPFLGAPPELLPGHGTSLPTAPLEFGPLTIGPAPRDQPLIAHVQIVDLEGDGRNDLLVCDACRNAVLWYRSDSAGQWRGATLGGIDLAAPCHT